MTKQLNKVDFQNLLEIESTKGLWNIKYKSTPAWHFLRENYTTSTLPVPRRDTLQGPQSAWKSITAIRNLRKRPDLSIAFISNRSELRRQIEVIEKRQPTVVFCDDEQMSSTHPVGALNYLRALFYISSPITKPTPYRELSHKLINQGIATKFARKAARAAISETSYLEFLSKLLGKKRRVFYSGVGVPGIEKYYNLLNSTELQHGIIHKKHPAYAFLGGKVKNSISIYRQHYQTILNEIDFSGKVTLTDISDNLNISTDVDHPNPLGLVIYTQPIPEFQKYIQDLIEASPSNLTITLKPHPRDNFSYSLGQNASVSHNIEYKNVRTAVCYTSSVIEPLLDAECKIVIPKIHAEDIDFDLYHEVYSRHEKFKTFTKFSTSIEEALEYVQKS